MSHVLFTHHQKVDRGGLHINPHHHQLQNNTIENTYGYPTLLLLLLHPSIRQQHHQHMETAKYLTPRTTSITQGNTMNLGIGASGVEESTD